MPETFLAVDWGTTNRRVFRVEAGRAVERASDARGVRDVEDFPAEIGALRARMGDLPMLLAGMVGSNIGWRAAPYVAAPAALDDLAGHLLRVDERTAIVPGVRTAHDVMRGEEVQLLGAVRAGLSPAEAMVCQPGTHSKWAIMQAGGIAGFTTSMTGELFALLKDHSLLAPQLQAVVEPGEAFLAGVAEGARRDLAASLFGVRAAALLACREDADAAAFASGILIGADVAARLEEARHETVHVLAGPALGALYRAAIRALGRDAALIDVELAFVAGMSAIWEYRQ